MQEQDDMLAEIIRQMREERGRTNGYETRFGTTHRGGATTARKRACNTTCPNPDTEGREPRPQGN